MLSPDTPRSTAPAIERLDELEFHHVVESLAGHTVVVFTGAGCGACRALKRALAQLLGQHADVRVFEVDAQQNMALTRELQVFHLPAMFLFVEGRFHCELHSQAHPSHLRAALVQALASPPQEPP